MESPRYFTLRELTRSNVAARRGIDNVPSQRQQEILMAGAVAVLDEARVALGCPLLVTSGYRCPLLNAAIGGSKRSDHMVVGQSCAFDLIPGQNVPLVILWGILLAGPFEKLIWEFGEWIHLSWNPRGQSSNNRQIMIAFFDETRQETIYEKIRPEDFARLKD